MPIAKKPYHLKRPWGARAKRRPKRKGGPRPYRSGNRYNKEIKFLEVLPHATALESTVGSALVGPQDSLILLPAPFESSTAGEKIIQGTSEDGQVVGTWMTMAYPTVSKYSLDYSRITLVNGQFPNIDVVKIDGFLKTTGEKEQCRTDTLANWQADCKAAVKRELFDAGYNGDFCTFKTLNRRIQIVSKYNIRPRKNYATQVNFLEQGGDPQASDVLLVAPQNNCQSKHSYPRFKTRLHKLDDGTMVPNSLYIPFTMFYARNMDARAGQIDINAVSKMWYTDA